MNERKTTSMLQRVPVILAVTAASYGLQLPPHVGRTSQGATTSARAQGSGTAPAQLVANAARVKAARNA